jgi:hypothetical protein
MNKEDFRMKNETLFMQYGIHGWPSPFYTISAQEKYNAKVEKFCNKLPDGAKDFTKCQQFRLNIYKKKLFLGDVIRIGKEN